MSVIGPSLSVTWSESNASVQSDMLLLSPWKERVWEVVRESGIDSLSSSLLVDSGSGWSEGVSSASRKGFDRESGEEGLSRGLMSSGVGER